MSICRVGNCFGLFALGISMSLTTKKWNTETCSHPVLISISYFSFCYFFNHFVNLPQKKINICQINLLQMDLHKIKYMYLKCHVVTSARSCKKVGHLLWFTILAQHETIDVILYIYSVHKHRGNSFQRQNYKMRLKQRSLNWINSMQVKQILFTNVFFSWSLCLLNMFPSMVFPKQVYFSGLLT
jgi:hypothetical protein